MRLLRRVFWDEKYSRFRAGWRLVLQAVVFVAFVVVLGLPTRSLGASVPRDPLDKDVSVAFSAAIGLSLFLSAWFAGRFVDRRRFADFGFRFSRSWWIDLAFGFAVGASLQAGIFLTEMASRWATITGTMDGGWHGCSFAASMIAYLLFFVSAGIYEETWNRGYLVKNLAEGLSFRPFGAKGAIWLAAIGTSIMFALGHTTDPHATLFSTLAFLPAGLLYAAAYALTGELAIPIGFHTAWNFFEGAVFGFPVSGYPLDASFVVTRVDGPALWTGGSFGPEAGLLGVLARLAGLILIVGWIRLRYGRTSPREDLAIPDLVRPVGAHASVGHVPRP